MASAALLYAVNGGSTAPLVSSTAVAVAGGSRVAITLASTVGVLRADFVVSSPDYASMGSVSAWTGQGTPGVTVVVPPGGAAFRVDVAVSDGANITSNYGQFYQQATTTATSSAGTSTATAAGLSAYSYYSAGDYGALDHAVNNNDVAIQAAVNACAADGGRRPVVIPRSNAGSIGNTFYNTSAPIEITSPVVVLRGENRLVTLRPIGFLGPCIIATPPITAPTPVQDGVSGFWGWNMGGSATSWLLLNTLATCGLNGLTAFTCEFWLKTATGTSGVILASSGRRGVGESVTSAFVVQLLSSNKIQITIKTSTAGTQTYTTTAALPNGTRAKVEIAMDQTTNAVRVYLGGVFDGSLTLSGGNETLVQGWEDLILGGQGQDWPYAISGVIANPPNATIYSMRLSDIARHTTNSSYTPETSEITATDNNTMLLLNFDPSYNGTSATSAAGMIKGFAQIGALTVGSQTPAYIPWQTSATVQMGGPVISDLQITGSNVIGMWIQLCPNSFLERLNVNSMLPIVLHNNCYLTYVNSINLVAQSQHNTPRNPKLMAFLSDAGGPQDFRGFQIIGGDISCVFVNASGQLMGQSYFLPNGSGALLIKTIGQGAHFLVDAPNMGDEGRLQSEFAIMVSGQAGPTSIGTATSVTGTAVVGNATNFTGQQLSAGMQVAFSTQPGVLYRIASVADNTHLTLTTAYSGSNAAGATITIPQGFGLSTRFNGGTPQLLSTSAPVILVDGGQTHEFDCQFWAARANGNVIFKFLNAPDKGVFVRGAQLPIFSNGTFNDWMPQNGTAGQGPIYIDTYIEGQLLKYPVPDADYNVPINDALATRIAPVGTLTAGRKHLLPLIAGWSYVWDVDNTYQTGTPQAVTYQGTTDGATGTLASVTIAAGKRARIAILDSTIGVVRLTADT